MATRQKQGSTANNPFAPDAEQIKSQEMLLNLVPQHPSTHGVLRLGLRLEGETVLNCTPVIGYLHRVMGKIFENRTIMQSIRYTYNSDYLSLMLRQIAHVWRVQ